MTRLLHLCLALLVLAGTAAAAEPSAPGATAPRKQVVVIPARENVDRPLHFIIRRGLKEAIEQKADLVVLDMKTPGGALDVTFDIMEALDRFPGQTITFVNDEALSAGAFISATTDEIWFAPAGVIGAAAPVLATGGEIDASMRQKIVSYLRARVRATSEGHGYRGQVISAMIDADYELKIGDRVLKPKGELLSLTAKEASEVFGAPGQPLLAAGIAKSVDDLLVTKYGAGGFTAKTLEVTWSEQLAVWLAAISPILLGLGVLALFIEFKTPGFGVFGIAGVVLLAIVFLGNYVAGLSGHEPILLFAMGLVLLAVEVIFFPGIAILALTGLVLMLGSLVWSMADLWPNEPMTTAWSADAFVGPLQNLLLGLALAAVLAVLLLRYLPKGWVWDRMVVVASVAGTAQRAGGAPGAAAEIRQLVGQRGVAVSSLRPAGQVEVGGRRYEAAVMVGSVDAGEGIVVTGSTDFGLTVERAAT